MRVFLLAAIVMLLGGAASAQNAVPRYGEEEKAKNPQQIEADKAAQKAYERSLNNIPDQGPTDPWGQVRTNDAPKASTAKPKAKSGVARAPN
jgi:hypothetical protein